MRFILPAVLLAIVSHVHAQGLDIVAVGRRCMPEAPISTLNAIVRVESGGNQNAMQIDFPKTLLRRWHLPAGTIVLKRQPTNPQEALAWLHYFESYGIYVDLGLMQVSSYEAKRHKIDPESLLDPCTNMRTGWQILEEAYRIETATYGPGQTALQHALSRYNTGDTVRGFGNGYVQRVLSALCCSPTSFKSNPEKRR
jgi:type IV secretion system protein VirB1